MTKSKIIKLISDKCNLTDGTISEMIDFYVKQTNMGIVVFNKEQAEEILRKLYDENIHLDPEFNYLSEEDISREFQRCKDIGITAYAQSRGEEIVEFSEEQVEKILGYFFIKCDSLPEIFEHDIESKRLKQWIRSFICPAPSDYECFGECYLCRYNNEKGYWEYIT